MKEQKCKPGIPYLHQAVTMLSLALALAFPCAPSFAADFATYECKSDLGSQLAQEITGGDPDLAATIPHNVYRFDFANKTVTFRMLNNKGKEFAMLGLGQVTKYTAPVRIDGDKISWVDVISDSPEGVMKADYAFDMKSGKMHVVTSIKPASEDAQTIDEDHTCTPYSPKKKVSNQ